MHDPVGEGVRQEGVEQFVVDEFIPSLLDDLFPDLAVDEPKHLIVVILVVDEVCELFVALKLRNNIQEIGFPVLGLLQSLHIAHQGVGFEGVHEAKEFAFLQVLFPEIPEEAFGVEAEEVFHAKSVEVA